MSGAAELTPQAGLEEETGAPAAPKAGVGERLRAAREANGLDADALAAALKLSKRQVEALEAGDWEKLPGHTFIRGFIRNYARVVHLDAAELLLDLDAPPAAKLRLDPPSNASAVMPEAGRADKRDYAAVLVGLIVVAVAIVAYFVVPQDLWLNRSGESVATVAAPAASATQPENSQAPLFPPGTTIAGDPVAPANLSAGAVGSPEGTTAPLAGGESGLHMSFAQPSWVEIRDRSGQIIHSQLNPANSERDIEGQPPFALVVGNAAHVTVSYKGRNIELQPRSKDDVARVTVE